MKELTDDQIVKMASKINLKKRWAGKTKEERKAHSNVMIAALKKRRALDKKGKK